MIFFCFFFFNDTATTEIYTLSLHDALPIWPSSSSSASASSRTARPNRPPSRRHIDGRSGSRVPRFQLRPGDRRRHHRLDRKSTRLNSSHANISYAVFCLKKKKKTKHNLITN